MLAILALNAGQVVSADRLINLVWADHRPATAPNTLQSTISFLRRHLELEGILVAKSHGYLLALRRDRIDATRAEQLIRESRLRDDPHDKAAGLAAALEMWRGQPLSGLAGMTWLDDHAARLDLLRRTALQSLVDARLALGEHAILVGDLEQACVQEPLNEELHARLMLALYRCGRQADALAAFHRLRSSLSDDLGISPSQTVHDLHTAILRQDRSLELTASSPTPDVGLSLMTPAQLPPVTASFVGRGRELGRLDEALGPDDQLSTFPCPVIVVTGAAGMGKTTLAVHWGKRVVDRFPDGQLYANLRGHEGRSPAADPASILGGFIEALGVSRSVIPDDPDARAGLYRSAMAEKRMLVVLDNAHDTEQVVPLLPGGQQSMVLITSRDLMLPLVIAVDALPLAVDRLTDAEARALLAERLGDQVLAAHQAACDAIVSGCDGLPLALAIVAARAAAGDGSSLESIATQVACGSSILDGFATGDERTDLRMVVSRIYASLPRSSAHMLRRLGSHPAGRFSLNAAASMRGCGLAEAERVLADLTRRHLLIGSRPGRYEMHGLVRAYVLELLGERRTDHRRTTQRLLDFYLHSAFRSALLQASDRHPIALPAPVKGTTPADPKTRSEAVTWLAGEWENLISGVQLAHSNGFLSHTWQLSWCLTTFLDWQGKLDDLVLVSDLALEAADELADPIPRAHALHGLARASAVVGEFGNASAKFEDALKIFAAANDAENEARLYVDYAQMLCRSGDSSAALDRALAGRRLARTAGSHLAEAHAQNAIGWSLLRLRNLEAGVEACEAALRVFRRHGLLDGEAVALGGIGWFQLSIGRPENAIPHLLSAGDLHRMLGNRVREAEWLEMLGVAYTALGEASRADDAFIRSAAIHDSLHDRPRAGREEKSGEQPSLD
ncbi:BTAD domain-containing putative transcriptional regulator [Kribbella ginsengisoli]|uniref:BTAD domain-containing putative transcriptional regulator n=1 Tax=Kribbella ginsengisoli TaxID=363865 RepID=A0ABP6YBK1_9ACTN